MQWECDETLLETVHYLSHKTAQNSITYISKAFRVRLSAESHFVDIFKRIGSSEIWKWKLAPTADGSWQISAARGSQLEVKADFCQIKSRATEERERGKRLAKEVVKREGKHGTNWLDYSFWCGEMVRVEIASSKQHDSAGRCDSLDPLAPWVCHSVATGELHGAFEMFPHKVCSQSSHSTDSFIYLDVSEEWLPRWRVGQFRVLPC